MTLADALPVVLAVVAAYLWGGIPTAYLVARFVSGIDIREYGSGNVGASNAVIHIGKVRGVAIGAFDMFGKGALPVLLARGLDAPTAAQAAVGLAAVAGHNWSPFIRFTGGRGVGAAGGVVLAFALWWEALICGALMVALGRLLLKDTGLLTLIAMIALPIAAFALGRDPAIVWMCAIIGVLLVAKRLTANWEMPNGEQSLAHTLMCRALWDRDVARRAEWTERAPNQHTGQCAGETSEDGSDAVLR